MRPWRPLGRRWRATRLHTAHRDAHHALPHTNMPESLAWACAGRERCPSVASDGAAQPLHAIRTLACSRLAFSAPSLLSTRGRRGVSAASSGARKPDAGRSPTTRLCGAGGGRAGRATPGGADAPHSKSTRSYEVVVINELEVHVEAWRWHEGASMVAAVRLGGATPRAPRGDHTWRVDGVQLTSVEGQVRGQRHASSAASAIMMVGTHRLVKVHVGLTVGGVELGEVQAPPRGPRLARAAHG